MHNSELYGRVLRAGFGTFRQTTTPSLVHVTASLVRANLTPGSDIPTPTLSPPSFAVKTPVDHTQYDGPYNQTDTRTGSDDPALGGFVVKNTSGWQPVWSTQQPLWST
jgi:hypothetical protein